MPRLLLGCIGTSSKRESWLGVCSHNICHCQYILVWFAVLIMFDIECDNPLSIFLSWLSAEFGYNSLLSRCWVAFLKLLLYVDCSVVLGWIVAIFYLLCINQLFILPKWQSFISYGYWKAWQRCFFVITICS